MKIFCANCYEHLFNAEAVTEPLSVEQLLPRPESELAPYYDEVGGFFPCPMCGFDIRDLATGLVLTGGGAMLEGACELAEQVFDLPVKLGIPTGIAGLSEEVTTPVYATAVGLLKYAVTEGLGRGRRFLSTGGGLFDSILTRMRKWMDEFF